MERNPWVSALILFLNLQIYISGVQMKPVNVNLDIWEGNVTVTWDPPQENPVESLYQVQMSDFSVTPGAWANVSNCNLVKTTVCNIGYLPSDSRFHVRVGALMPQGKFSWSIKRFINIHRSQLYPPSFSLLLTPFSVQVKVHRKHLENIFPYGLIYTAYLWPKGQENKTKSEADTDNDAKITFSSLQPLQEYCVRVQVKSESSPGPGGISSKECIRLPLDMTLMIYFVFLGLLGFVAVLMLLVCCFLRRPGKMPAVLKPVVSSWKPMIVGSIQVETVTDKGWLLITDRKEEKTLISEDKTEFTEEEKDRRESLDSGVSMEQLHSSVSNTTGDVQTGDIQEDSGCGSLKGSEGSGSIRRDTGELFSLAEINHEGRNEGREDSGLGLSHREVSASLEGEDNGLLSEIVVGDGYRSQSPSSMDVKNESPGTCNMDAKMAAPSDGYRSGQVTCMCSEHEYCLWCKFKKPSSHCQSVTPLPTNFNQTIGDTDDGNLASSNYQKKNMNLLGMEDTHLEFPESDMNTETSFLFSCPLLLQSEENQACITDTNSFTLDDVKLTFF